MHRRPLRRATILALTGLLAFAGTAMADQLLADGDVLTTKIDGTRPLPNVPAGGEVSVDVRFVLTCTGLAHVDLGQSVVIGWSGRGTAPPGGTIVSVTPATIGPITDAWAPDSLGCPDPVPSLEGNAFSRVTLRAPTTSGFYTYTVTFDRSLSPAGINDDNAFSRTPTTVSFTFTVPNIAPTLTLPPSHSEEGNTTGGWVADWSGVSATDPEDNPDPTLSCLPAAGNVLPVDQTTHVVCRVTDLNGATTTGSFDITVVDTTDPVLVEMPADVSVTTGDPNGLVVTYTPPTATDIVDPSPAVDCSPASGAKFSVDTTTVECTATDANGNSSSATFSVTVEFVAANTAPTLNLPASHEVEGNTTGGWTADWSDVSATDPEDNPDPTPTCVPAAGTVLPLGPATHVVCTVTDTGGATTTGSFDITVVDTTPPSLADVPADRSVTTGDPDGAVVTFASPAASDIVDPSPVVGCSPASGETFSVGTTPVTCTATDASGNSTSARFTVEVRLVAPPHTASAIWLEPVGDDEDAFEANHSRTIPVKVRLFVDGVERSSGQAQLTLTPCGGGTTALEIPLSWGSGRWSASLDTSMLPGPCYTVSASIDGHVAGSFHLELRGEASPVRSNRQTTSTTESTSTALPKKAEKSKPR